MKQKWIKKVSLLMLITFLFLTACSGSPNGQPSGNGEEQETVTAFIGDLAATASASGQVQPRKEATLSVETPGIVTQVHVRVGDTVQPGDVLLRTDAADLELNVANAEQTVALRQANLDSLLAEPEPADVKAAETAVSSAQTALDKLLAGATEEEIAIAEANLRASQASLASASGLILPK